jgi:hypothetical protein
MLLVELAAAVKFVGVPSTASAELLELVLMPSLLLALPAELLLMPPPPSPSPPPLEQAKNVNAKAMKIATTRKRLVVFMMILLF